MGQDYDNQTDDELREVAATRGVLVADNASREQIVQALKDKDANEKPASEQAKQ